MNMRFGMGVREEGEVNKTSSLVPLNNSKIYTEPHLLCRRTPTSNNCAQLGRDLYELIFVQVETELQVVVVGVNYRKEVMEERDGNAKEGVE